MGVESTLWGSHKDIALVLWVSMPSPCKVIDKFRQALVLLLDLNTCGRKSVVLGVRF